MSSHTSAQVSVLHAHGAAWESTTGSKIGRDCSQKKTNKWMIGTWKDAQQHFYGNVNQKPVRSTAPAEGWGTSCQHQLLGGPCICSLSTAYSQGDVTLEEHLAPAGPGTQPLHAVISLEMPHQPKWNSHPQNTCPQSSAAPVRAAPNQNRARPLKHDARTHCNTLLLSKKEPATRTHSLHEA